MVEATHNVQQAQLRGRLAQAAMTLAQYEAEKAVKQALKGQGLKLSTSQGGRLFARRRNISPCIPS